MKKRILSCFLALAMALSLLPMSVLAAGDGETNTSSLSPSSVSDGNVSISKTATRTGEDTWDVTMTVTAKEKDIESEPLELVLLLDRSGSMAWCTHNNHHHSSFSGGYWCRYEGETSAKDSRQAIAGNAAKNLIDQLVNLGISVSVSVVGFESDTNVLQSMTPLTETNATSIKNNIPTSGASGGTYMNEGLKAAAGRFSDSTTNKVIVLLADGDYDGTNPNGLRGYVSTLKNENITVHTIGFTTKNNTLSTIASSTGGQYYTADDASELANVFTQIAEHLTAMVEDDMGDDVQIVGTPSATNGAVTVSQDGKLSWNPEDGTLDAGETATITYQVKLTDSTKTTLQVGDNSVNLNSVAVLTYRVNEGPTKTLTFPVPTDTVQVGQLTTKVMLNDSVYSSTPGKKVIAYGDNSFSWVLPEDGATLEKDGITYTYAGSTYDDESISDTSKPATTGTHTLVHSYVSSHTLTYTWSGLPAEATETLPTGGTYQYGAPVKLDETYSSGDTVKVGHDTYTFSGWTATPDLEDGKMPASNVTVSGTWTKTGEDPKYTVTYEVTSSENPSDYSPEDLPNTVSYYEGDSVTVASPLTSSEETKDDVSGTWKFSGWSTEDVEVINNQFTMPADAVTFTGSWSFKADTHTITINYVDNDNEPLQLALKETQTDNSAYSFDVSSNDTGDIPFIIINKEGTQYVFDHFTTDSDALSGTLKGDVTITAVYLVDENENNVPDIYDATVTYHVVNGTWGDDSTADKTVTFELKEFDHASNTWVAKDPAPTLGDSIPAGMKPVSGYAEKGSWNTEISENTPVTGDVTYTYSFGTKLHSITINYEDGDSNPLKDVYTATQNDGSSYSFDVSRDDDAIIPFVITTEDGTHYVYDSLKDGSADLSGNLTSDIIITAVYLVDENENNVPDVYEATVTYKVVNGTWQDGSVDPIERVFPFKMFDEGEFIWIDGDPPTLNGTIPTGMTPNAGFAEDGAWAPAITNDTPVTEDATYTYTFEDRVYTLTYDANGGRGTMTDENSPYQGGSTVTVLDNEFYWTRHTFTGWNTEADGSGTAYQPGDTFEISSDTTLYAQWRYTGGGGTVEPPVLDTENHYGYIVGYDDGTVRPNGKITRAEVATIFFRLLTDESRDAYWCQTNDFSDVSASDWYNNAISTLTNAGILDGYEDGTFRPNGNITRAEFATIAVRFFDLTYEGEDLFPDISDHWARDYINQAAAAGFVNGYEDGTFRPNNAITRAEAVTLVNRTLERKPHKAHLLADMIQWPDNMDQTTWYYADIQEATNSHEYYMTTSEQGEEYEIWTELLPMRDWPALEKEWSDANSSTGADVTR